jgi:hypothetical protein
VGTLRFGSRSIAWVLVQVGQDLNRVLQARGRKGSLCLRRLRPFGTWNEQGADTGCSKSASGRGECIIDQHTL